MRWTKRGKDCRELRFWPCPSNPLECLAQAARLVNAEVTAGSEGALYLDYNGWLSVRVANHPRTHCQAARYTGSDPDVEVVLTTAAEQARWQEEWVGRRDWRQPDAWLVRGRGIPYRRLAQELRNGIAKALRCNR